MNGVVAGTLGLAGGAEGGALGAGAGQSPNRPVSVARGTCRLRGVVQQEDHMHSSIVLMVMTRCAALAALTFALTLAPSLSGGDLAEARAVKQKTCSQKYFECYARCQQRAIEKYGPTSGSDPKNKAVIETNNCDKRTCLPQLRNCKEPVKKSTTSEQPPGTPAPPTKVSPKAPVGGAVGTKP